jgi:hypothetical protein
MFLVPTLHHSDIEATESEYPCRSGVDNDRDRARINARSARFAIVMNTVVRTVAAALWTIAFVLVDVEAAYSCRPLLGPGITSGDHESAETPSAQHMRSWLARRLSSPPGTPLSATA